MDLSKGLHQLSAEMTPLLHVLFVFVCLHLRVWNNILTVFAVIFCSLCVHINEVYPGCLSLKDAAGKE